MRHNWRLMAAALVCGAGMVTSASAVVLTSPGDVALAINPNLRTSAYPAAEAPKFALDNFDGFSGVGTKYLNFAGAGSGLIFTPGASTVQSMQFTTANDADGRDPTSWALFGTNSPITSADNSSGNAEPWTPIASGGVALPTMRNTPGPLLSFANATSYSSYKLYFPTLRSARDIFQISDVQFFPSSDGSDAESVERPTQPVIAIVNDPLSRSGYPGGENPTLSLDGNSATKYLNFAGANSGIIVTLAGGPAVANGLRLTTANDAPDRDPTSYEIYGTNAAIVTGDNGTGLGESWTLVSSGALALPNTRFATAPDVLFSNNSAYKSYKIIFPTVNGSNLFQIADIALVNIPEPGSVILAGLAVVGLCASRRRCA